MLMKKPDDSGRKFRAMIIVIQAPILALQNRLGAIDEGGDQKPADHKFRLCFYRKLAHRRRFIPRILTKKLESTV
jgi:hypothetical protein